jgi:hypothetical protein
MVVWVYWTHVVPCVLSEMFSIHMANNSRIFPPRDSHGAIYPFYRFWKFVQGWASQWLVTVHLRGFLRPSYLAGLVTSTLFEYLSTALLLSHCPRFSRFCFGFGFWDRALLGSSALPWIQYPVTSASCGAGITGMYNHTWLPEFSIFVKHFFRKEGG